MKCPICEKDMKKFVFNNPKEIINQCNECDFHINIKKTRIYISIKEKKWVFFYNKKRYNRRKDIKYFGEVERFINHYRNKNNKKKIRYFHPLMKICSVCGNLRRLKYFYKTNRKYKESACCYCHIKRVKRAYYNIELIKDFRYQGVKDFQRKLFNKPLCFSKKEFIEWLKKSNFDEMFKEYIDKDKSLSYSVCVSRIDGKQEFTLDNMIVERRKDLINRTMNVKEKRKMAVVQMKDGNIIKIWKSIIDTQRTGGYEKSSVNRCCQGIRKHHKGFQWKYLKDL